MKIFLGFLPCLILLMVSACTKKELNPNTLDRFFYEIERYPHRLSNVEEQELLNRAIKVSDDMRIEEALKIMGRPHEVRRIYERRVFRPKVIGTSYWYVIRRDVEQGSEKEKAERAIRISTDLDGFISHISRVGYGYDLKAVSSH